MDRYTELAMAAKKADEEREMNELLLQRP